MISLKGKKKIQPALESIRNLLTISICEQKDILFNEKIPSRFSKFLSGPLLFSFIELRRLNMKLFNIAISIVLNRASIIALGRNCITQIEKNWDEKNSFLLKVCKPILFSKETISTSGACRSQKKRYTSFLLSHRNIYS